jgi:hypothetical protein
MRGELRDRDNEYSRKAQVLLYLQGEIKGRSQQERLQGVRDRKKEAKSCRQRELQDHTRQEANDKANQGQY